MTVKYEINNPVNGSQTSALTFEEAKQVRDTLKAEYIAKFVNSLFYITVLVQNEDNSWTQSLADEEGNAIPPLMPDNLE